MMRSARPGALAEAIVPGGGRALVHAVEAVERAGVRFLRQAQESPIRQIAQNSDFDAGVVVDHTRSMPSTNGFDANLIEAGIIDPAARC